MAASMLPNGKQTPDAVLKLPSADNLASSAQDADFDPHDSFSAFSSGSTVALLT